jgi:hypothetical protein
MKLLRNKQKYLVSGRVWQILCTKTGMCLVQKCYGKYDNMEGSTVTEIGEFRHLLHSFAFSCTLKTLTTVFCSLCGTFIQYINK